MCPVANSLSVKMPDHSLMPLILEIGGYLIGIATLAVPFLIILL